MRTVPKAALLVFIASFITLVHAVPSGPLGEAETARLRERLDTYYSVGRTKSGRFAVLEADRYASLAVVPHLLSAVLAHPDADSSALRRRNVLVLSWAAHLAMSEGARMDLSFIRAQMQRQLGELLARYPESGDARISVVMMFDKLALWTAAQLPFLAFEAGHPDDYVAERALLTARQIMPDDDPAATAEMARVIRAQPNRTTGQWALLAQSGHVTYDELGTMLILIAHEFAGAEVPFEIDSFRHQNPVRDVLEDLMTQYGRGDEVAIEAFRLAEDLSESSADFDTPLRIRRTFFNFFAEGILFDEHPAEPWLNLRPANDLVATGPASADEPATASAVPESEVIHVDFATKRAVSRSCGDRFTKP